jgi:hypothetical protein
MTIGSILLLKQDVNGLKRQFLLPKIKSAGLLSVAMLLVSTVSACGGFSNVNEVLVRVQGTPGIPYEVKINAGNDTDVQRGNGDGAFSFETDDCLISVEVNSSGRDRIYAGLWINDEYDDRDTSTSGYVILSGSCL